MCVVPQRLYIAGAAAVGAWMDTVCVVGAAAGPESGFVLIQIFGNNRCVLDKATTVETD